MERRIQAPAPFTWRNSFCVQAHTRSEAAWGGMYTVLKKTVPVNNAWNLEFIKRANIPKNKL